MASVIPGVRIKRTGWGLFIRVVWLSVLCLILAGMATAVGGTFWVFLVILWLPGVALALVIHRAGLTATGDVLTYRVPLRTRAWHRGEIAAFWLEKTGWTRGMTAHIGMETTVTDQVRLGNTGHRG
jgi:hypothetical protein